MFDLAREWFGKFTALFSSGVNPINGTCKFFASEWKKSQQQSRILGRILSGGNSTVERCLLVGDAPTTEGARRLTFVFRAQ